MLLWFLEKEKTMNIDYTQQNLLINELHSHACEWAKRYLKTEGELFDILQKNDRHRAYFRFK
jgi:hypothetical protein